MQCSLEKEGDEDRKTNKEGGRRTEKEAPEEQVRKTVKLLL